jgi:hypothetical protein
MAETTANEIQNELTTTSRSTGVMARLEEQFLN